MPCHSMKTNDPLVNNTRVWSVSSLCSTIAERLQAEFNPVQVLGEISNFTRAASGHCYFSIKDDSAQLRCAMFKRSAGGLRFAPREGMLVEVRGRLDLYAPRGDFQLIVEEMAQHGQGDLFEQFMRLKAALEAQGLFDAARKRPLPLIPRRIGLVTSLGAAALHDVVSALQRRAPHVQVVLSPSSVQGEAAPAELVVALQNLYAFASDPANALDAILLVRGGGSLEDLWAFNDQALAHCIAASPVPIVSGVGHETDFTIADFVADVRAPTPTAAAELVSPQRDQLQALFVQQYERMSMAVQRVLERQGQRLDQLTMRLGQPSVRSERMRAVLDQWQWRLCQAAIRRVDSARRDLNQSAVRLQLLDPRLVLQRGYAMLLDDSGQTVGSVSRLEAGQTVTAQLADGKASLQVL